MVTYKIPKTLCKQRKRGRGERERGRRGEMCAYVYYNYKLFGIYPFLKNRNVI